MNEAEEAKASLEDALAFVRRAKELKGEDPVVLDVSKIADLFRFMLIVTANSRRHAQTLCDVLSEEAKHRGVSKLGIEGYEEGKWVLLDLNDVLVHVFLPEVREYYGLEDLWADAPTVVLDE
ncbi:MAG: ribosome silencing factor [Planctomycetota bacterium]|jgi:ribosome-associated protein